MLVVINLLLVLEYNYRQSREHRLIFDRVLDILHATHHSLLDDTNLSYSIFEHSQHSATFLQKNATPLLQKPLATLYSYDDALYFVGSTPPKPPQSDPDNFFAKPLFIDPAWQTQDQKKFALHIRNSSSNDFYFLFFLSVTNIVLILFFVYFIRKLLPLKHLEKAIANLDNYKNPEPLKVTGKDEISNIAMQYNHVRKRLNAVEEARTLFLRNIVHELNTPFMKGKLLSISIKEESLRQRFEQLFGRMEFVLGELAKIEKVTSGSLELDMHPFRLADLYEHAYDLLLIDTTRFSTQGEAVEMINADFEYFAIAIKNLLDNALKYSEGSIELTFSSSSLKICSRGEKLQMESQDFEKPFNRSYEGGGLGLGLYISNTIIKKHHYDLHYTYKDGFNCFTISW